MQPYRTGIKVVRSQAIPGVTVAWRDAHATVEWNERAAIYSSAFFRGGRAEGKRIVNYMVDRFFDSDDPVQHMREKCAEWGYTEQDTVGLMTAAKVTHMSLEEVEGDQFALLCCVSAGTSNAARAGAVRTTYSAYVFPQAPVQEQEIAEGRTSCIPNSGASMKPGTINILVVIDGRLKEAAIMNALMTITEAKTAALMDLGIRDAESGRAATGTTSDAAAIAVLDSGRYIGEHQYAGTATTIGDSLARLVYDAVTEAVSTQAEGDPYQFPTAGEAE